MAIRLVRCSALAAHGCHGLAHLIALLLATAMGAEPLLGQLQGALEGGSRADLQQLDHASLIRRKAHHLTDHLADETHFCTLLALAVGLLGLQLPPCHNEALVETGGQARCRRLLVSFLGHVELSMMLALRTTSAFEPK